MVLHWLSVSDTQAPEVHAQQDRVEVFPRGRAEAFQLVREGGCRQDRVEVFPQGPAAVYLLVRVVVFQLVRVAAYRLVPAVAYRLVPVEGGQWDPVADCRILPTLGEKTQKVADIKRRVLTPVMIIEACFRRSTL